MSSILHDSPLKVYLSLKSVFSYVDSVPSEALHCFSFFLNIYIFLRWSSVRPVVLQNKGVGFREGSTVWSSYSAAPLSLILKSRRSVEPGGGGVVSCGCVLLYLPLQ